jgi:hypothetical protein
MKTGQWLWILLIALFAAWWAGRRSAQRYDVIAYSDAHRFLIKIDRWTGRSWHYIPQRWYWLETKNLTPEQLKTEQAFDAPVSGLKKPFDPDEWLARTKPKSPAEKSSKER